MKNYYMSILILSGAFGGASLARADSIYPIITADGRIAEVSTEQLLKTYGIFMADQGVNRRVVNADGSVSVINPHMMWLGKITKFDYWGDTDKHLKYICDFFKLGNFIHMDIAYFPDGKMGDTLIYDIGVSSFRPTQAMGYISALTCKNIQASK